MRLGAGLVGLSNLGNSTLQSPQSKSSLWLVCRSGLIPQQTKGRKEAIYRANCFLIWYQIWKTRGIYARLVNDWPYPYPFRPCGTLTYISTRAVQASVNSLHQCITRHWNGLQIREISSRIIDLMAGIYSYRVLRSVGEAFLVLFW